MWLILTFVCCDGNILLFTQEITIPASASAEIRICIGLRDMRISDAYVATRRFSFDLGRAFGRFFNA